MRYEVMDLSGCGADYETIAEAAATAVEWANDDMADSGEWNEDEAPGAIRVCIGQVHADMREVRSESDDPDGEDEWMRLRGWDDYVEGLRFHQVAAVVSAGTMRDVLRHLRDTGADAALVAAVRASLLDDGARAEEG
jgi:hypothetical protein